LLINGKAIKANDSTKQMTVQEAIRFYIFSLSTLIISIGLYGQTTTVENPMSIKYRTYPEGENKIYYSNGALNFRFNKKNGRLQGDYLHYNKNGRIGEWDKFDNGQFHGPAISFNQNGDTTSFDYYLHDTLLVSKQWTYYKRGMVKDYYSANFKDSLTINTFDKKDTSHKKYFEYDMNKLLTKNYNVNVFTGYYKTGELKYTVKGIKWQYEGEYIEYFKSGKVKEKGYYKSDQLEGDYIIYNENGSIKSQKRYRAGKLISKEG
jgi:antitoxin component YwqK of YwqJK toxin-antitoxin module